MDTNLYFFTATINQWIPLLKDDSFKTIITDSLSFLVKNGRVKVYAFVIMTNHIHLIWLINENHNLSDVQRDFLKFTAQQFRFRLIDSGKTEYLEKFNVDKSDRQYLFWQSRPLSVELWSDKVIDQKMDYIHNNPCQEKEELTDLPENYKYSSASFYINEETEWNFLSHIGEL